MRRGGNPREGQAVVRIVLGAYAARLEGHVLERNVQLRGRDLCQLFAQPRCCDLGRTSDRRGKARGVVARGDGPGIAHCVHIGQNAHRLHRQAELVGHDLRQHGPVALTLRDRGDLDRNRAERVDCDGCGCLRAILGPRFGTLFRGQDGGDVAHIRHRRLNNAGKADAIASAFGAGLVAAGVKLGQTAFGDRAVQHRGVITRVVERTACRAVGKRPGRDEVAADDLQPVQPKLPGDGIHQPLQREIDLWAAKAAVKARWRLVRKHDTIADRQILDVVGTGHVAVHPVERSRLRRAQMGTAILDLIPIKCGDPAIRLNRRFNPGLPIGRRNAGRQMLQPVLDPLDRRARDARGDACENHVGKDALLDSERATGIGRCAQPQPVARHVQRPGHHRVD